MNKIILLAIIALVVLTSCTSAPTLKLYGESSEETIVQIPTTSMDEFAQCTADNGAIMYGADWCPHCKYQKETFGDSFAFVNYVECEDEPKTCSVAGIRGYPSWIKRGIP